MKKILLLLLTTGFFAKPILAQDCTSRPEQPIVDVFPTFCGSPTAEVYVEGPNGDDIQFVISTVGSSETITASNGDFRLNVGHSYIIFSQFISTGCTSATGTEITIDASTLPPPAPSLKVVPPACGSNTGTATVANPLGADYEYSDNDGASYQASPIFTIAAGAPYSITYHQISTSCVSTPSSGTMAATPPPQAPIIYVNANANGLNNGTSWTDAYKNLQDALANAGLCVTQIWVAKGTYYPDHGGSNTPGDITAAFAMRNNLAIYGGFDGTETDLAQRDWKNNVTILSGDIDGVPDVVTGSGSSLSITGTDGNSINVIRNVGVDIFHSSEIDNTAILDGFTISGASGVYTQGLSPAAMFNNGASATVSNCVFRANHASGILDFPASLHVNNCTFEFNETGNGAILESEGSSGIFANSIFIGNKAVDGGGAVFTKD